MEYALDHLKERLSGGAMGGGQYGKYPVAKAFLLIFGYQDFFRIVVGLGPAPTCSVLEIYDSYEKEMQSVEWTAERIGIDNSVFGRLRREDLG